jgi:anti-sigma regulatory factor (Ser/Thr protein kinase)
MMAAPADAVSLGLSHMIYPYAGAQQFLSGALAYIERARETGAAVIVAAPTRQRAALEEHLADDGRVSFMDTTALGRNPGRLIPAWQDWIGRQAEAGVVHGINEPAWASGDVARQGEARYEEWLLNLAFAQAPAWSLLCPVDTTSYRPKAVEALARCHPLVWNGADHVAAVDYLADAYEFDELPEPPAKAEQFAYRLDDLQTVRDTVSRWALRTLPTRRARELTLAVSEVATNSIRYGGGSGTLRFWRQDDALVCEVRDGGVITDPLAGRVRPPATELGGRGLWFVHRLCDLVQIRSVAGRGTCIRLWIDDQPAAEEKPGT